MFTGIVMSTDLVGSIGDDGYARRTIANSSPPLPASWLCYYMGVQLLGMIQWQNRNL